MRPPPPPPNPPPPPPPPTYALPVTILAPLPVPVLEQQPGGRPGPGPGPPPPPPPPPPSNVSPVPLQSFSGPALPVNLIQVAAPVPVFVLGGKLDAGGGPGTPRERASSLNASVTAEIRRTLVALASLNAEGLARQFESLLVQIPYVGPALAATVGIATAAMQTLADAIHDAQRRLVSYSPQLAVASAQADVRQTFGDIQRAQQLGSGLARFTEAESRLSQTTQNIEAALLEQLLPLATEALIILNAILIGLQKSPEAVRSTIDSWIAKLPQSVKSAFAAATGPLSREAATLLAPLLDKLRKIEDNTRKKEPDTDVFTDELFGVRVLPAGFIPPPRVAGFTGG